MKFFILVVILQFFSTISARGIFNDGTKDFTKALKEMCKGKESGKLTKNEVVHIPNGCGPSFLDKIGFAKMTKVLGKKINKCCDVHDSCYGTCVKNSTGKSWKLARDKCDSDM